MGPKNIVGTSTTTTTTTVRKQHLKSKRSQEIDERKNEGIVKSRAHGRKQEETKRLYSKIKIKTKKTNKKANLLCPLKKTNTKYAIKIIMTAISTTKSVLLSSTRLL